MPRDVSQYVRRHSKRAPKKAPKRPFKRPSKRPLRASKRASIGIIVFNLRDLFGLCGSLGPLLGLFTLLLLLLEKEEEDTAAQEGHDDEDYPPKGCWQFGQVVDGGGGRGDSGGRRCGEHGGHLHECARGHGNSVFHNENVVG
jgi:hypothetical protein